MNKHDSKTADELMFKNAPEGATHISNDGLYLKFNRNIDNYWWSLWISTHKWVDNVAVASELRSLADITELVELRKKNAELEKVFANVLPVVAFLAREGVIQTDRGLKVEFDEWLAIRYLEQQAKGATDAIESVLGEPQSLTSEALSIRYEFLERLRHMREQAKQLKEQNN